MKKYRVHTPRNRLFEDLDDAIKYAEAYLKKTGSIVAITRS